MAWAGSLPHSERGLSAPVQRSLKMRSLLLAAGWAALALGVAAAPAGASHPAGGPQAADPVDGPLEVSEEKLQHSGSAGHLPASAKDVELVGKLDNLTNVDGGIADVGYHAGYAYLNAFSPECAGRPGAQGTGVHVVDVRNPANPRKVGFLAAEPNSYVGEGIHVVDYGDRDILVHNNETCDSSQPVTSGFSVWDVTQPLAPVKIGQFGDREPAVARQMFHTTHSVQAFVWRGRAYAVAQDNNDLKDVDIFDLTPALDGTGTVQLVSEQGLEDWPGAQSSYANGDTVFHHDMQQKVIDGHNVLAVSYWDAGQVLLNIDDPANPVFVGDSDYPSPDPEFPSFTQPEGNSHQSYFDQDGDWLISTDEDFSPTRTLVEITSGPNAGQYGGGEFSWAKPIPAEGVRSTGGSVWGGSGCTTDENGDGTSDRAELPSAASTGADTVAFSRGSCFFSDKVRTGEEAGYRIVIVGQSHAGTRGGLLKDGYLCGGQGSPVLGTAHAICIGHRAMHLLFDDAPAYSAPEGYAAGGDMPAIGARGAGVAARSVFDGWGYVWLHDARRADLPAVDSYAVAESKDPAYRSGFGNLTVHEVKTDPRQKKDLAYFSYYDAGLRVAKFGAGGITEIGHYIAEGGNDFWGVLPVCAGQCELNDRDQG
ncbi:MAG TPA: hypothetical protein VNW68_07285, partial [Candidatus Limnocylindria bacterium]|nr:hypothetical protein [Candidatus Limnocylindria bacterium]